MRLLTSVLVALSVLLGPSAAQAAVTLVPGSSPLAVEYRGAFYFVAGTGALRGLYQTSGTVPGTHLVVHVNGVEAGPSYSSGLAVVNDRLVFTAYTSYFRTGLLMISDGTAAGTRRLLRAQRGPSSPRTAASRLTVDTPIVAGNQLYVNVGDRWLDPSATLSRVDVAKGTLTPVLGQNRGGFPVATTAEGSLLFVPHGKGAERGLWSDSGTRAPVRLGPIAGAASTGANPRGLLGDQLYFVGDDAAHGAEPWVTDGTPGGTHLVADLRPGTASSNVADFAATKQAMYAMANGPGPNFVQHVPYLLSGPEAPTPVTLDRAVVDAGATTALSTTDDAVWIVSGAYGSQTRLRVPSGRAVAEQPPGPVLDENRTVIVPGTQFYISGDSVRSTDTAGVTTILATAAKSPDSKGGAEPAIYSLSPVGNGVWFRAPSVNGGRQVLWRSDGTIEGTGPVAEPGQIDPVGSGLVVIAKSRRDTSAPYRYALSGTLYLSSIIPSTGPKLCGGTIDLTISRYGRLRRLERAPSLPLRWNGSACVFDGILAPSKHALEVGRGRLSITARFSGTDHVAPQYFPKRFAVRYG